MDDSSDESSSIAEGSSKSSEISEASHESACDESASKLAERIHARLCAFEGNELPVKCHRSAVNSIVKLRVLLLKGVLLSRESRMLLLYAGIATQRRELLSTVESEASDLKVTLVLLFVLQLLCEGETTVDSDIAEECTEQSEQVERLCAKTNFGDETLTVAAETSLFLQMVQASQHIESEWEEALKFSTGSVCRACLCIGNKLRTYASIDDYVDLSRLFFRNSSLSLKYSLLEEKTQQEDKSSFLTLGSLELLEAANDELRMSNLAAIASAGESEVGQQILRDLILSFQLPPGVVGVRRFPLLSRQANETATTDFTPILGEAHEAAMAGAEWLWENSENTLHRMCSLLAGLSILLAGRGSADHVRKNDCFRGRLLLPFLETTISNPHAPRMELIPQNNEWVVYKIDKRGEVEVVLRAFNFEGFCDAALLLAKTVREGAN